MFDKPPLIDSSHEATCFGFGSLHSFMRSATLVQNSQESRDAGEEDFDGN